MQPKHKNWLFVAEVDLIAATKLIQDDDATLGPSIFHTQQCAEKALKAFLIHREQDLKRTHDLIDLVKECCKLDQDFSQLLPAALDLNPHSSLSRYPDDRLFIPYRPQVVESVKMASFILDFVKSKIR